MKKRAWRKPEVKSIVAGSAEACSGKTGATTDTTCTSKS